MKNQMKWIALLTTAVFIFSGCKTQKQVRLVLLPDIQTYSRLYPDILKSQTQWAIDHADSIDFVLQQGDMTDHNVDKEWEVSTNGEYHCRYPLHAMLSPVYLPKHSVRLNRSTVLW